MIITENLTINNRNFTKRYSDQDMYLIQDQTGKKYSEAIDVENASFTYTESDEPIHTQEEKEKTEIEEKAEAYDIIIGGIENESN